MPFGAVFTSSSGGDIGGGRLYTRFRGPLLVGTASTAEPGGQTQQSTGNIAGSAAQPMYSYYTAPNMGMYAFSVTTAGPESRYSVGGVDSMGWSSAGIAPISTGFASTAGTSAPVLYITQTSAKITSSAAGTTGVAYNAQAAIMWDSATKKLVVFSTVTGEWLGSAAFTSS